MPNLHDVSELVPCLLRTSIELQKYVMSSQAGFSALSGKDQGSCPPKESFISTRWLSSKANSNTDKVVGSEDLQEHTLLQCP